MRNLFIASKKFFSIKRTSVSFDVDGVLKKGNIAIPRAKEAIIKLKERAIPVSLITNGGGELEGNRGDKISNILSLEDKFRFKSNEVFLGHTAMKNLFDKFKEKLILITGIINCGEVIESYGFKNYMTVHEYFTIFEEIVPLFNFIVSKDERSSTLKRVEKRLGKSLNFDNNLPVSAIFIMTDVANWEVNAQVSSPYD